MYISVLNFSLIGKVSVSYRVLGKRARILKKSVCSTKQRGTLLAKIFQNYCIKSTLGEDVFHHLHQITLKLLAWDY